MTIEGSALLSVYNKDGIIDFARGLTELGIPIIASGGTAQVITAEGIQVRDVSDLVGGKAILGHRVVTLSPKVHAGLLATDSEGDMAELEKLGVPRIGLVCVDMYPLEQEIKREGSTRASVIEKTDIGGPTMLRSGAKGARVVICDPVDRRRVLHWLKGSMPNEEEMIEALAAKAEFVVGRYILLSAACCARRGLLPSPVEEWLGSEISQLTARIINAAEPA